MEDLCLAVCVCFPPEELWRTEDLSIKQCIKSKNPSAAHHHQVGRTRPFAH